MCTLFLVWEVFTLNVCAWECKFRSADDQGQTTGRCGDVSDLANKTVQLIVISKASASFKILCSYLLGDNQLEQVSTVILFL